MKRLLVGVFLVLSLVANAFRSPDNYDFLRKFEPPRKSEPEHDTRVFPDPPKPLNIDLKDYYAEFEGKKGISIYIGGGAQIWNQNWPTAITGMISSSNLELHLGLQNIKLQGNLITFQDNTGLPYSITVGNERDEFISALEKFPIVVYLGHSRYGRGPAFQEMSYYFRLGDIYPTIEVDTRNPYFLEEPLMETETYPPMSISLEGKDYQYQYQGEKNHESYLGEKAYTKIIEGGPKDFMASDFAEGKQLIFLYSCENVNYFRKPIRSRFEDPQEKLVFGTLQDAGGLLQGVGVFIVSVIQRAPTSLDVIKELNKVENLFTAY